MGSVSLLMSVYGPDPVSMRELPTALDSLEEQDCDVRLLRRLVECPAGMRGDSVAAGHESMPETLNALWPLVDTDYAGIFNCDDTWFPRGVDALVALLDEDPSVVVAYGDFEMVDEVEGSRGCGMVQLPTAPIEESPVPGPFALFRVSAARGVLLDGGRLLDESYLCCFDWHLWVRLRALGSFAYAGHEVGRFLYRQSSRSRREPDVWSRETRRIKAWAPGYLRRAA